MKRYLLRYLICWLPAAVLSFIFRGRVSTPVLILQWFFAFFMLLSWAVNTGMAAYRFPRNTLSFLLIYSGLSVLAVVLISSYPYGSLPYTIASNVGGALNFRPLDVFCTALKDFNIKQEYYVLGFFVGCCLVGYVIGLLYRRIRPNPYRPRIQRYS